MSVGSMRMCMCVYAYMCVCMCMLRMCRCAACVHAHAAHVQVCGVPMAEGRPETDSEHDAVMRLRMATFKEDPPMVVSRRVTVRLRTPRWW